MSALDEMYQDRLLDLADSIARQGHPVAAPSFVAAARSRACGSSIEIAVRIEDDVVVDYGQTVDACALGSAAASAIGAAIVGATVEEVRAAGRAFEAMLIRDASAPTGRFSELEVLRPARAFRNRHGSMRLAFTAFEAGLKRSGLA